jgi:hypothetical protein
MKSLFLLFTFFIFSFSSSFAQSRQSLGADNLKIGTAGSAFDSTIELAGTSVKIKGNKTTGKAQFTNDGSVWKNLGAGSGSGAAGQTFNLNGSIEDGFAVNHSYTGSVATEVTGTSALEGDKSVVLDFTALNDYYRSDYFTVPKGLYGSACELRFKYRDGDANTYVKVENEVGTVIGQYQRPEAGVIVYGLLPITSPGYESVYFKCPTQADVNANSLNGKIRYVVYQGTASNAAVITMDLFSQGELIGLVETTTPDELSAHVSLAGIVTEAGEDWINGNASGTSPYVINFNTNYFSVIPVCTVTVLADTATAAIVNLASASPTAAGISYHVRVSNTAAATTGGVEIKCSKKGADAKQAVQVYKSIPKIAQNINALSAKVSVTGVVSGPNTSWINGSCTWSPTGILTCPVSTGVFSIVPNCSMIGTNSLSNSSYDYSTSTITSLVFGNRRTDSGITFNDAVTVNCDKTDTDFKLPTVQPIVIGQVTNSAAESGLVNVRTESCTISNAGSASIDTASGLCSGWVSSVNRSAAGAVTVTVAAGVFSATPACYPSAHNASNVANTIVQSQNTTTIVTLSETVSGTDTDMNFSIFCIGKR